MVKLRRCTEAQLSLFNKPLPLDLHNKPEETPAQTHTEEPSPNTTNIKVYSQEYAKRARELENLKGQDLLDAVKEGDVFEGTWGYNRTITDWFIVKRKTAKRIVVHKIERKMGDQPGDSWGGWTTCPVLPPRELTRGRDLLGIPSPYSKGAIQIPEEPKYIQIWDGTYGWENQD